MTDELRVFRLSPRIDVDPTTRAVAVVLGGPQGIPGAAGAGALTHVHTQSVPSASWTWAHGLGRLPLVAVWIDGAEVDADVTADTVNVTITLATPMVGVAISS